MATEQRTGRQRRSLIAAAYMGISTVSSVLFYLAARATGSTSTDAILGVVWVFALSAIVSASILPPALEKWQARRARAGG